MLHFLNIFAHLRKLWGNYNNYNVELIIPHWETFSLLQLAFNIFFTCHKFPHNAVLWNNKELNRNARFFLHFLFFFFYKEAKLPSSNKAKLLNLQLYHRFLEINNRVSHMRPDKSCTLLKVSGIKDGPRFQSLCSYVYSWDYLAFQFHLN